MAFTLIELLSVIAITAILAALILPAMSSFRKRVSQTKCMAQLREWSLAINGYAQDHNGMVRFYRWFSGGFDENFYNPYFSEPEIRNPATGKMGKTLDVLRVCPANPTLHTYFFVQPRAMGEDGHYHKTGVDTDDDGRVDSYSRMMVERPSQFLMMMDIAPSQASVTPYDPAVFASHVKPMCVEGSGGNNLLRHGGKVNGLFGDGHVQAFTWSDLDVSNPENTQKLEGWFNLN